MSTPKKSSPKKSESQIRAGQRKRVYAFILYPESAKSDWLQILTDTHVRILVSPLHDKDKNPEFGSKPGAMEFKKAHHHILMLFDGPKDFQTEIVPILDAVGANRKTEPVISQRGYARYLCHLDNPEKAQYNPDDIIQLNGVNYEAIARSDAELKDLQRELFFEIDAIISNMRPTDFNSLCNFLQIYRPDCLDVVRRSGAYYVVQRIKDTSAMLGNEVKNIWTIVDGVLYDRNEGFEVRPYWEDGGFNYEAMRMKWVWEQKGLGPVVRENTQTDADAVQEDNTADAGDGSQTDADAVQEDNTADAGDGSQTDADAVQEENTDK